MATDALVGVLSLALQAVSSKALLLVSLCMTGALYGWSMWMHEWISLAVAATWSLLVFLPLLLKGDSRAKDGS
jgi:hypothetical protein